MCVCIFSPLTIYIFAGATPAVPKPTGSTGSHPVDRRPSNTHIYIPIGSEEKKKQDFLLPPKTLEGRPQNRMALASLPIRSTSSFKKKKTSKWIRVEEEWRRKELDRCLTDETPWPVNRRHHFVEGEELKKTEL